MKRYTMFTTRRRIAYSVALFLIILIALTVGSVAYQKSVESPPNLLWALFSGYYRYDPRQQTPPQGLFLDRPEASLTYFFDSTLKRCGGTYPPLSLAKVVRYEVEEVEYIGHTDYHAFSLLHTRIYFDDGRSVRVVFRFEAGHNEAYPLLLMVTATVRVGSWMALGSFVRDPDLPPPGWTQYQENERPFICNPGPPYTIEGNW